MFCYWIMYPYWITIYNKFWIIVLTDFCTCNKIVCVVLGEKFHSIRMDYIQIPKVNFICLILNNMLNTHIISYCHETAYTLHNTQWIANAAMLWWWKFISLIRFIIIFFAYCCQIRFNGSNVGWLIWFQTVWAAFVQWKCWCWTARSIGANKITQKNTFLFQIKLFSFSSSFSLFCQQKKCKQCQSLSYSNTNTVAKHQPNNGKCINSVLPNKIVYNIKSSIQLNTHPCRKPCLAGTTFTVL